MYKKIFLLVFYVYKCRGDFRDLKKFKIFDKRAAMWDSLRNKKKYIV